VAARLVARLDGMPLAIEPAAARVEALGLGQLIERLEDSFRLLTSTDRPAAERHRSLAATVEWSYQLLGEEERQVFRRLAMSPARSLWTPRRLSPGPPLRWWFCIWSTVPCSRRPGLAKTAGPGT
jgi:hypothetical protein